MSKNVLHKACNTDETYTNYKDFDIISTSKHAIIQMGNECTAYTINVTRSFLDAIKDKGGSLTFSGNQQPLLRLSWKGNTEISHDCITKWKVDFLSLFKGCKSAIMQKISAEIFHPLRLIIERIFHEYDAQLSALIGGSLIFVFMHRNRQDADKMIEKKQAIHKIFQQLLGDIGNREVKFALSAERVVKSSQWFQSLSEDSTGIYPSDERSESLIPSSRIDSIEMELKQVRESLCEMKNVLLKMSDKILSETDAPEGTPLRRPEEQPTSALVQDLKGFLNTNSSGFQVPESTVAPAFLSERRPLHEQCTAEPDGMGARVSHGKTNLTTFIPEQRATKPEPSHAESKPRDHIEEIQRRDDRSGMESAKEIPEYKRQQDRFDLAIAKNYQRAEMLLSNLSVCNVGDGHGDPRVNRLAASVAVALEQEDPKPPKAQAQDTVLCLDVSESLGQKGFEEVKQAAHMFVNGIETVAEQHGLEENLALVVMGGGVRVVRQLTNDYTSIRDAIDDLFMVGRSPIFEALVVCIAAIKEKGGTLSIGGVHNLKPRIIFLTDGYATDDSVVEGPDLTTTDQNIRLQIVQLTRILGDRNRDTEPVVWVSAGNADRQFLTSLSKLGRGTLVECKDIENLCKYYRIQENIGKIYICIKNSDAEWGGTPETIETVTRALTGDMDEDDREFVIQGVKQKLEFCEVPDPDEKPSEFHNVHEVSDLPPLGTRVVRGLDWQYGDQDCEGPGTIVNHANNRYTLWVLWDLNGMTCRYRYGHDGKMDVVEVEDQPRFLLQDEFIEIGVRVKRGVNWSFGDQDGGVGSTGVVIRKREDGVVKVKWQNGHLNTYKYGLDGKMDIAVCEPDDFMKVRSSPQDATTNGDAPSTADAGGVGCATATQEKPNIAWQRQDKTGKWQLYSDSHRDKMEKEFTRKPSGSCLLQREGKSVRVHFKHPMVEKEVGGGTSYAVKRSAVSHVELRELKGQ
ncbi:uncharacterized protein [Haliotis cracherodii]|uniref:uncharacterized protein n=1 Tax=Haliotis cracherodii TaxID=6455 RepID=UPI0039E96444